MAPLRLHAALVALLATCSCGVATAQQSSGVAEDSDTVPIPPGPLPPSEPATVDVTVTPGAKTELVIKPKAPSPDDDSGAGDGGDEGGPKEPVAPTLPVDPVKPCLPDGEECESSKECCGGCLATPCAAPEPDVPPPPCPNICAGAAPVPVPPAPQGCGTEGARCCADGEEGPFPGQPCDSGFECGADNTCVPLTCGFIDGPCCDDAPRCGRDFISDNGCILGVCTPNFVASCTLGEQCCGTDDSNFCQDGFVCDTTVFRCVEDAVAPECGKDGQECCVDTDMLCEDGLVCQESLPTKCVLDCGSEGKPCCPDAGINDCGEGTVCDGESCVACGDEGEACCLVGGDAVTCNDPFVCEPADPSDLGSAQVCKAAAPQCGGGGAACCPDDPSKPDGGQCEGGFTCDGEACVACGGAGQPCCFVGGVVGISCDGDLRCAQADPNDSSSDLVCTEADTAQCGWVYKPCCAGGKCKRSRYECKNGKCVPRRTRFYNHGSDSGW